MQLKRSFSNGAVAEETKDVLLCDGKIHLNLVQQLFDLPIIEMKHGMIFLFLVLDSPEIFSIQEAFRIITPYHIQYTEIANFLNVFLCLKYSRLSPEIIKMLSDSRTTYYQSNM